MRRIFFLLAAALLAVPLRPVRAEAGLTVSFLNVGKADAILLQTEQSAVLIDAATEERGEEVARALRERGVQALDLLVVTHYDKDHVGGADRVIRSLPVAQALDPAYPKDSKQYWQYVEALAMEEVPRESLTENRTLELDGVRYGIDVANASCYGEDEENDFSLVIRAEYGQRSFLFAGDAERPRLAELLEEGGLASDVLKVPHHGQFEKNSLLFFRAVGPSWAVITSSPEEPEDEEVLWALLEAGAEPLLTREGTVTFFTDGETLELRREGP